MAFNSASSTLRERLLVHREFLGFASEITLKLTLLFIRMTAENTSGPCHKATDAIWLNLTHVLSLKPCKHHVERAEC